MLGIRHRVTDCAAGADLFSDRGAAPPTHLSTHALHRSPAGVKGAQGLGTVRRYSSQGPSRASTSGLEVEWSQGTPPVDANSSERIRCGLGLGRNIVVPVVPAVFHGASRARWMIFATALSRVATKYPDGKWRWFIATRSGFPWL